MLGKCDLAPMLRRSRSTIRRCIAPTLGTKCLPGAAPDNAIGYAHTHPKIDEIRSCRRNPLDSSAGNVDVPYTESHVSNYDRSTVTSHNLDFGIMMDSEVIKFFDSNEVESTYPRCGF